MPILCQQSLALLRRGDFQDVVWKRKTQRAVRNLNTRPEVTAKNVPQNTQSRRSEQQMLYDTLNAVRYVNVNCGFTIFLSRFGVFLRLE